jgi:hypothetical protein
MVDLVRVKQDNPAVAVQVFRLAVLGALSSGVVLFISIIIPDSKLAEALIFSISPLVLIPVIPALHWIFSPYSPRASSAAMIFGMVGISPIVISIVLSGLLTIAGAGELSAQIFGRVSIPIAAVTALLGVWMVLAGYLGLTTKTLPNGLAVAGIAAGLTRFWIIASVVISTATSPAQGFQDILWNVGILAWIASHLVWTIWLGGWLFFQKAVSQQIGSE